MLEDELRDVFNYDPMTGLFYYAKRIANCVYVGDKAGSTNKRGYVQLKYKTVSYLAHRVAWLFIHNTWPTYDIDHINGIKVDNRIINLRDVPTRVNMQNMQQHREGKVVGAYQEKSGVWKAQCVKNGKKINLGRFPTQEEAHLAYLTAIH